MARDFSLGTVEVSLSPRERFEEYLQSRGKRTTQQRRLLVDLVFGHHDHFDADDVIDKLAQQDITVLVNTASSDSSWIDLSRTPLQAAVSCCSSAM